ncbi:MAG: 50S ribosomal protein L32 [Candidatus Kerfeldbacteria bacterium]|nr:50S ribosomal protein L32 [Candidatus Kerfeldbacteria bacterium]
MPVPPKRHSKGKTRRRRSHHAISPVASTTCPKCGSAIKPHYACPSCGYYRGRDVMKKAAKVEAKVVAKKAPRAKKTTKKASKKTETTSEKK